MPVRRLGAARVAARGALRPAGPARGPLPRGARRARGDRGSTTFEFLGMFPYILLILVVIWQCIVIGYTFSLAGNAADEAARAGAVGDSCSEAASRHVGGAWGISASCTQGRLVHATVALRVPVLSPSLFNLNLTITGTAAAVNEREDD